MSSSAAISTAAPPRKRLLFDRRYGWVLDEWREPSQEALSGGRGMFCILPLAKVLLNKASESVNFLATSTLKVIERPELLSPRAIHDTFSDHVQKTASSMKHAGSVLMAPKRGSSPEPTTPPSSDVPEESIVN